MVEVIAQQAGITHTLRGRRTAIAKSLVLSLRNSLVHGLLQDLINVEIIVVLAWRKMSELSVQLSQECCMV